MTREEAIEKWVIPALKNTWNEKRCNEVLEALEQEPCTDTISREEAVEELKHLEYYNRPFDNSVESCMKSEKRNEAILMAIKALEQEPCDAVSRKAAIDACDQSINILDATDRIKALPSVTPAEKVGHWINVNEGKWNTIPAYKCSECGANADLRDWSGESPYCPWCGCKMQEVEG